MPNSLRCRTYQDSNESSARVICQLVDARCKHTGPTFSQRAAHCVTMTMGPGENRNGDELRSIVPSGWTDSPGVSRINVNMMPNFSSFRNHFFFYVFYSEPKAFKQEERENSLRVCSRFDGLTRRLMGEKGKRPGHHREIRFSGIVC